MQEGQNLWLNKYCRNIVEKDDLKKNEAKSFVAVVLLASLKLSFEFLQI